MGSHEQLKDPEPTVASETGGRSLGMEWCPRDGEEAFINDLRSSF